LKLVRLLLIWLGVLLALVAILVAVCFTSPLQTWVAQSLLDRQPGWQSSIGEVSAGFGKLKVTDLHVDANGAVLTMPSLEARLPLSAAAWDHHVTVRSLVAKGWTLDLSNLPDTPVPPAASAASSTTRSADTSGAVASGPPTPAQAADTALKKVEDVFRGILGGWKSPYDLAVDGVDLEGDVIVAVSADLPPVKIHVLLKGGGLSGGHEGEFTFEGAAEDPSQGMNTVATHGRVKLAMSSPRALSRVEITADLTTQGGRFPDGLAVSVNAAASHTAGETAVTFDLLRDQRHVAAIQARASAADPRVTGNWKVDVRDADLAPFVAPPGLPALAATGEGSFESDAAFSQVRVRGHLEGAAEHLDVLMPVLARAGRVNFGTQFDLTSHGRALRIESLDVVLAGARPIATVHALQPFYFDGGTGALQVADPAHSWLDVSVQGLPLDWLSGLTGKFVLSGGDVTGRVTVQAGIDGFGLTSEGHATGVSLAHAGRMLGRELDVELGSVAMSGPDGWRVKCDPLTITQAGGLLAKITVAATRPPGSGAAVTINGTWNADLDAMASQPALAEFAGMRARATLGDFTVTVDNGIVVDTKVNIIGHDPTHSLTATVHAESPAEGVIEFKVPITLSVGKNASVFSAEGSWSGGDAGDPVHLNGRLTGEDVDLDHLRLLVAPLAAAIGVPRAGSGTVESSASGAATGTADLKPFWAGWAGEVTLVFDRLRAGARNFQHVGATFDFDATAIELKRAWVGLSDTNLTQAEGSLSFDGSAEFPYRLKATVTVNDIDAAPFLGAVAKKETHQQDYKYGDEHEEEPVLEGHFSLAATLTGTGRTPDELLGRAEEEYHVTSKGGIIRLLKTSVGEALPGEPPSPVGDAASTVGGWVGWLAGVNKDSIGSGEKKVPKNTDAVLNLTSQIAEIGYDQLSVTATRGRDQTIHLVSIELIARDERLTGSGQIAAGGGQPLAARPLAMDLKLSVRGNVAALLTQAGLLTKQNDELGYLQFARTTPLHFGGTLQNPDVTDWHDLLAKAAMPPATTKPAKK
jgi:hypothetical protein